MSGHRWVCVPSHGGPVDYRCRGCGAIWLESAAEPEGGCGEKTATIKRIEKMNKESEKIERLTCVAAEVVGKWIYVRKGYREWVHVERYFVQTARGDRVLDLSSTDRPGGCSSRMLLVDLDIVLVQTREEEVESRGTGETLSSDTRRMDWLQQLHRSGHLLGMVQRLPHGSAETELRRALDKVMLDVGGPPGGG